MARPSTADGRQHGESASNDDVGEPSRRLTVNLEELKLGDVPEGPLNKDEFLELCRSDPGGLFEGLFQHLSMQEKRLEEALAESSNNDTEEIDSMREEIQNLKSNLADHRQAMSELITERDAAIANTSPAGGDHKKKTTKLPDGQLLSDGIDPKYESWEIDVENKLEANADHYPTALARMAYVKGMCKGEAANHLLPRFRKDSAQRYQDVGDIFEHLRTIYMDENRVINAKMELRRLAMRDSKFQIFLSKFTLLAQEAGLALSEWKEELYHKLSFDMQRAMIKESTDPMVSYQTFVQGCHTTANRLEQIAEGERRARSRGIGSSKGHSQGGHQSNTSGGSKPKNEAPQPQLSWEEKKKLMSEDNMTVSIQLAKNGYSICTKALADTGANGFAFLDVFLAEKLARHFQTYTVPVSEPCGVRGYDGKTVEPVTHLMILTLVVDGRMQRHLPFLLVRLGRHDVILGRMWLEKYNVLVDCRNRRLLWPEDVSLKDQMEREQFIRMPKTILRRNGPVNLEHQADMERRDRLMEEPVPLLQPEPQRKAPAVTGRTQRTQSRMELQKMEKALRSENATGPFGSTKEASPVQSSELPDSIVV
ncbi:uncharacterized protein TRUGW13939_05769 [Talaromyces rugulosus]|uniref:Uncharacterized protein n=1 Tax=Talaromyces rugulosus TaxID=121627 RepID=A0A7H8QPB2_TALRU|nr:uncharacterized protein TRUGW13939_01871 [Talaromyces rugulosus]XP_035341920.1 uncharacterized protein TRUGW13939_02840 [Talaromyces rugulosus]XP_035342613.1 uncharacterized protein TRUGW13939_03540 [Talaromyces rugulosus]XP_035344615.1 uncharacterized protein TRUGW13939_05560 [Talaromyces rugulosus]XP_035344820.1 uncharacterized protein TRUGW13939_05769 [Talaromyces rugulosus]QKX54782.1 hypothetical protein TRUGW13939_01871 [Talaromyces rugulosus]QKX55742.1 hypothetical protein TRUGW13939